jgi:regulator of replication initiation timing
MQLTNLVPILTAVIAGVAGVVGGPALAGWFARRAQKIEADRQAARELATAKISGDEADRARISKDYQWTIDDLRREVTALYARQAEMRVQLDGLGDELATVRRANIALRLENDELKERLGDETAKHDVLKRRVDGLDAANLVLRRELHRHGIAVPALAQPEPTP